MNTLRLIRMFGPVGGKQSRTTGDLGYKKV